MFPNLDPSFAIPHHGRWCQFTQEFCPNPKSAEVIELADDRDEGRKQLNGTQDVSGSGAGNHLRS
jgi:hypothetical protein